MTTDLKFFYSKFYLNGKQIKTSEIEGYTSNCEPSQLIGETKFNDYTIESIDRVLPNDANAAEFDECSKIIKYSPDEIWRIHLKEKQIAA
ncbi:MAG: hypothetical protein KME28_13970 [Pelatocladus maniniholoensis HA4357-MV3]|jgi:hypothetical protein|uniref:Uncharacterized protein n=1 Tax=Pelatocladus maniniholoensis HA4357-MV3 TaxID=1117104 RepID=A0A9E3H8U7_9NOST|nr:hypothetical protein [Pelatocladus maniniholoensis HA4357-MV3]BAZ69158.1 hypothetical protein NIES4106_39290 [Fischerella sp. NIES-4106]